MSATVSSLAEHTVPAGHVLHILDLVRRRWGVTAGDLLDPVGLREDSLDDPGLRVPGSTLKAVIERARLLTGEPALGIFLGLEKRVTFYGYLGFAIMHASTLGEALELAVQYTPAVATGLSLRLQVEGGLAAITVESQYNLGSARDVPLFSLLIGLGTIGGTLTGRQLDATIDLDIAEPDYFHRFAHVLPVTRFNQPQTRVMFDAAYLSLPLATPDRAALRLAREQCDRIMIELGLHGNLVERTRRLLLGHEGSRSLEEVARDLHVSRRTLKRRLAESGATFSDLRDAARRERALLLLQCADMSLEAVAERLGYATVASFVRAFRRWTGQTPAAYRRERSRPNATARPQASELTTSRAELRAPD